MFKIFCRECICSSEDRGRKTWEPMSSEFQTLLSWSQRYLISVPVVYLFHLCVLSLCISFPSSTIVLKQSNNCVPVGAGNLL